MLKHTYMHTTYYYSPWRARAYFTIRLKSAETSYSRLYRRIQVFWSQRIDCLATFLWFSFSGFLPPTLSPPIPFHALMALTSFEHNLLVVSLPLWSYCSRFSIEVLQLIISPYSPNSIPYYWFLHFSLCKKIFCDLGFLSSQNKNFRHKWQIVSCYFVVYYFWSAANSLRF